MIDALIELGLFSAKGLVIVLLLLFLTAGILAIVMRNKEKTTGRLSIKHLNEKYEAITEQLFQEILPKKAFKSWSKAQTKLAQAEKKKNLQKKNAFLLHFNGDIKASAVTSLSEEVTAIVSIASPEDEVIVCIESPGGMVNTYGLAAAQLQRFRRHNIPLTVVIDKVAASGGYMMACVANKIISAPFAIIGSIGVILQLPNFNRFLKDKKIDFEQLTAGNYKRTINLFAENTEEGREKCREELANIHHLFKNLIQEHRPQLDVDKVANGEHWLGSQALSLNLVDAISTSDDYLLEKSKTHNIFAIQYYGKKSLMDKLSSAASLFYR